MSDKSIKFETTPIRPIHYMGNKSRLLPEIVRVVFDTPRPVPWVIDPFAGTGVVARAMADRAPVIAGDVQEYSKVLVQALVSARPNELEVKRAVKSAAKLRDKAIEQMRPLIQYEDKADDTRLLHLIEHGSIRDWRIAPEPLAQTKRHVRETDIGFMTQYYGGVYFSYRQAVELDAWRITAEKFQEPLRSLLVGAALSAASECATSVGAHFAQPINARDSSGHIKTTAINKARAQRRINAWERMGRFTEKLMHSPPASHSVRVHRRSFVDLLQEVDAGDQGSGVVYADPPYTRDHYSRFYHVLETLARGDNPGLTSSSEGTPSKGLYRIQRHQSPFSIVSQAPTAFDDLVSASARVSHRLVISYSPLSAATAARANTRVVTPELIAEKVAGKYSTVITSSAGFYRHSKFNQSSLNAASHNQAEMFIIGQN